MWQMNYDEASMHWFNKDKDSVHMGEADLKDKIESFIESHNTCALATATTDMVRNTPLEYTYHDGTLYIFSEGGLKFKCLKDNKNVGLAIYESYAGFNRLKSLQVEGVADIVEPFSEEYLKIMDIKKIPLEAMKNLEIPMHLIKVIPKEYDYLDSDLKKDGYAIRQHIDI